MPPNQILWLRSLLTAFTQYIPTQEEFFLFLFNCLQLSYSGCKTSNWHTNQLTNLKKPICISSLVLNKQRGTLQLCNIALTVHWIGPSPLFQQPLTKGSWAGLVTLTVYIAAKIGIEEYLMDKFLKIHYQLEDKL